jgi:predicted aconitase
MSFLEKKRLIGKDNGLPLAIEILVALRKRFCGNVLIWTLSAADLDGHSYHVLSTFQLHYFHNFKFQDLLVPQIWTGTVIISINFSFTFSKISGSSLSAAD